MGLFLIFNCGLDREDPPSPPVWVEKSLPEEWPEHGIDAHESEGIYLEWRYNLPERIKAYKLFRTEYYNAIDSLGDFVLIIDIDKSSLGELEYIDRTARVGHIYH